MKDENFDHSVHIENIAALARIYLTDQERQDLAKSLDEILEYFDKLKTVNVEGVEPSAHAYPLYDILRDDKVGTPFDTKTALQNAPRQRNNQVIVPKVVE
ncbi:MAG: Asp-tRNA(Asn)/Glu-tRNA(Gln) amidotransferase subunit GatC [Puniceicoccales bacterium]|jgi:aspartyl-tRNA(Asn)/glutamyl-tRNA(Gln) amidotransferase subunit C|nr:Asp-tRNA(Asn)/Glu-tRNA(Gln) amidotransferase subunit GatC [Puniceicoccales bacterium]